MYENSLYRDDLDWTSIYEGLMEQADSIHDDASLYNALHGLLNQLGDNHSFLLTSDGIRWPVATSQPDVIPDYEVMPEPDISYIEISPVYSRGKEDMRAYADSLHKEILAAYSPGQIGWILDFRRNTGGQLWPMLAALSPLIQSNPAGQAAYPEGILWSWWAQDGQAGVGTQTHFAVTDAESSSFIRLPIAILVSNFTASSGEACVISFLGDDRVRVFGTRTSGLATVNQPFELSCGAVLMVTTAYFGDRTGRTWPNGIEPDQVVADGGNAMLEAIQWVHEVAVDSVN